MVQQATFKNEKAKPATAEKDILEINKRKFKQISLHDYKAVNQRKSI